VFEKTQQMLYTAGGVLYFDTCFHSMCSLEQGG